MAFDFPIDPDQDSSRQGAGLSVFTIPGGETASQEYTHQPNMLVGPALCIGLWNALFLMEVFEMPQRGRPSVQKKSRDTTVVQFRPSTPAEIAAKVSQKMGQKAHSALSSGADPGPAGFDWEELKSTDDTD